MEYSAILAELKKKNYRPVYLLQGDEPYFIDLIAHYIEKNVLDDAEKEFNQTILYGADTNVPSIISVAKRYPMMSDRMVLIIKEAQTIKKIEELESYVNNPLDSTILVICYKNKKVDKRTSFAKIIGKKGVLFDSARIRDYKIPEWISGYIAEKKYSASPKALQLLAEYLGNDLGKIVNELEKLMISLPPGTEITTDHIQQNIGISKDFNVFELNDALTKKDVVKANRIVNYFAANSKDHPMQMTLGALYSFFSKVLQVHFVSDKSKDNLARSLGVSPYFVQDYIVAGRNYPAAKLKAVFGYLREYDLKGKGVENESTEPGELLKELVWKILH
ncbi:MAG TPA: DNA polymerase III subunit delta [Bacteroidia bacterium]|nr:DNA polymerase III subunit delta [Bacteroidia bacterium]